MAEPETPQPVRYFRLPGAGPGKFPYEGAWADVLEAVPYFLMAGGPIPPRDVANEVLRLGVVDAGMSGGCEWDPTELDEASYNVVVEDLLARPPRHIDYGGGDVREVGTYQQLPAPEWVHTQSDFLFWSVEVTRGLPGLVHRDLRARIDRLVHVASEAYERGDVVEQDRLEAELVEAEVQIADLWRRNDRWRRTTAGGPDHVARHAFNGRRRWS